MFLPSKKSEEALADRIVAVLVREIRIMSQALSDKLAELGVKEDEIIAILNTDSSAIAALTAANAALAKSQGDDSAQVAEVQGLIDKLSAVIPPAGTATPPAGSVPPVTPPVVPPAGGGPVVPTPAGLPA